MARLLVADVQQGIERLKRLCGDKHQVVATTAFREACELAEQDGFDCVIVGVHFAESRMYEFIKWIKENGHKSHIPIIAYKQLFTPMSDFLHDSIKVATKALGACTYIDSSRSAHESDPDLHILQQIESCLPSACAKRSDTHDQS